MLYVCYCVFMKHKRKGVGLKVTSRKLFLSKCVAFEMTMPEVAEKIGMHFATLSAKVNNHRPFTVDEVNAIRKLWNLTMDEVGEIFFGIERQE